MRRGRDDCTVGPASPCSRQPPGDKPVQLRLDGPDDVAVVRALFGALKAKPPVIPWPTALLCMTLPCPN